MGTTEKKISFLNPLKNSYLLFQPSENTYVTINIINVYIKIPVYIINTGTRKFQRKSLKIRLIV
jgi:hypothetical protein